MSKRQIRTLSKTIENALNNAMGGRVAYVIVPGRGIHRRRVSHRATQVFKYLSKHRAATATELQRALKVNRNVISGAVFQLRTAGLVKSRSLS